MSLNNEFPLEIVRTNRKRSVSIEIVGDAVRITIPKTLSKRYLNNLIERRTPWIRRKLEIQSKVKNAEPKKYIEGESFLYLGKNYRLKIIQSDHDLLGYESVRLQNGCFIVSLPKNLFGNKANFIKSSLEEWYKKQALKKIIEKTSHFEKQLAVKSCSVKVRDYKSRWGCCSATGNISYNWRIIIAPHCIVDYVVVHELCHLLEHNHSPKYWQHVANIMPSFKEHRNWLKINGATLFF